MSDKTNAEIPFIDISETEEERALCGKYGPPPTGSSRRWSRPSEVELIVTCRVLDRLGRLGHTVTQIAEARYGLSKRPSGANGRLGRVLRLLHTVGIVAVSGVGDLTWFNLTRQGKHFIDTWTVEGAEQRERSDDPMEALKQAVVGHLAPAHVMRSRKRALSERADLLEHVRVALSERPIPTRRLARMLDVSKVELSGWAKKNNVQLVERQFRWKVEDLEKFLNDRSRGRPPVLEPLTPSERARITEMRQAGKSWPKIAAEVRPGASHTWLRVQFLESAPK